MNKKHKKVIVRIDKSQQNINQIFEYLPVMHAILINFFQLLSVLNSNWEVEFGWTRKWADYLT